MQLSIEPGVPCFVCLAGFAWLGVRVHSTSPRVFHVAESVCVQEDRERPYKTMEQRLAAYRQECEARLQEEVQRQVYSNPFPVDVISLHYHHGADQPAWPGMMACSFACGSAMTNG